MQLCCMQDHAGSKHHGNQVVEGRGGAGMASPERLHEREAISDECQGSDHRVLAMDDTHLSPRPGKGRCPLWREGVRKRKSGSASPSRRLGRDAGEPAWLTR